MEGNGSPSDDLDLLTYSSETSFQSCRRLYYWRNIRHVVPVQEDSEALWMGSAWHEMAEIRDRLRLELRVPREIGVEWANAWLDMAASNRHADPRMRRAYLILGEALAEYERRYTSDASPRGDDVAGLGGAFGYNWIPDSDLEPVGVEREAIFPLVNPATGAASRTFRNAIKVDMVVRRRFDGKLWLVERKLLSDLGDTERLWTDFQLARYARHAEKVFGERLEGAIYDVVLKPKLRIKDGKEEREDEHAARVAVKVAESAAALRERLAKKDKSPSDADLEKDRQRVLGLKTMQRVSVPPETDDEFRARLREKFKAPDSMARVPILFDRDTVEEVEEISWESSQLILDAKRRGKWRKNLGHCYHHYGRVCPYVPLCRDRLEPDDAATGGAFMVKPPHQEIGRPSAFDEIKRAIEGGQQPADWKARAAEDSETIRSFFDIGPGVDTAPPADILDLI